MKHQQLFEMIERYADLTAFIPEVKTDDKLSQFYKHFSKSLQGIVSELGGEIITLKERSFDPKMMQLLEQVYQTLIIINRQNDPNQPYIATRKMIQYVLEKPNAVIIDNLDFLIKNHLARTNIQFEGNKYLQHPQSHALDNLKALAIHAKNFINNNPDLIAAPKSEPTFEGNDREDQTKT